MPSGYCPPASDAGDFEIWIVAVTAVENVKIAAGGPHDDYFPTHPYLPRQAGEYRFCSYEVCLAAAAANGFKNLQGLRQMSSKC
jgi:hypothetical protein